MPTTAHIEYRDHVGEYEIAIKFCEVEFYGQPDEVRTLERTWRDTKFENYDTYNAQAKEEAKIFERIDEKIRSMEQELSDMPLIEKIFNRSRYNALRRDIEAGRAIRRESNKRLKKLENKRFKKTKTLIRDARNMLACEGFACQSTSHSKKKNITTEIWVRE